MDWRSEHYEELRNAKASGPVASMRKNTGFAGIIVVIGFLLMGVVTMPVLILAAVPLGIAVALLLHFRRKD